MRVVRVAWVRYLSIGPRRARPMLTPRYLAVTAQPNLKALPGSNVLQKLVNGAEAWALSIALLGAFVGAALWAVASHTHNHHHAARGRMVALISGASALVV